MAKAREPDQTPPRELVARTEVSPAEVAAVGLCTRCRHASRQASARGSAFWRCLRAEEEPGFRRYPPLPVHACRGFEERELPEGPS